MWGVRAEQLKAAQAVPQLTVSSSLFKPWRWGVGWAKQFYGMLKQWREEWNREDKELRKINKTNLCVPAPQYRRAGRTRWKKIERWKWMWATEREGACASIRERERERELRCSSIPHQTAEDCQCVCVTALLKRGGGGRGWACLQTLQGHRGTHSGSASVGPHQVEVPAPSSRRPPPLDPETPTPPRPPAQTPWHKRPNISARTRI